MQMTKVYSSSPRSIPAHKSSALKIAQTELENKFSNLLRLVADKRLHLLHLICLPLLQRVLSQVVTAASSPPRFFAAWRVKAHFSAVFSFDGFYALCHIWSAVLLFVNYHLAPEKVPLVIVVAHAISSLAFFLLRYGFIAVKLQWCRKLRW